MSSEEDTHPQVNQSQIQPLKPARSEVPDQLPRGLAALLVISTIFSLIISVLTQVIDFDKSFRIGALAAAFIIINATLFSWTIWALGYAQQYHKFRPLYWSLITFGIVALVSIIILSAYSVVSVQATSQSENRGPTTSGQQVPPQQSVIIAPNSGPPGSAFTARGSGFLPGEMVRVELFEGPGLQHFPGPYPKGDFMTSNQGEFQSGKLIIDREICCAGGKVIIRATGRTSKSSSQQEFTVS